ncbi:MAG: Flp family type IVb pilin [Planctomycetia bacterium]|nr:Flp family type IVb pilin [Planctomycetia bacterium]
MNRTFRPFWRRTDAATSVEYAVMLALILMVVFGAVASLGTKNNQSWTNTNNSLGVVNAGS